MAKAEFIDSEPQSYGVARTLIDYIFSGQVVPGDRLPSERKLSEHLGVGRSTVREGIKSLGLLGLLEFRHGGGTYLRGMDSHILMSAIEWGLMLGERQVTDLVEARTHIETALAGLAAARRTEEQLAELDVIVHDLVNARNAEEAIEHDVKFHLAVAEASGNAVLANALRSISALLEVWIHRVIDSEQTFPLSRNEHEPIFNAIRDEDTEAARRAMEDHLTQASERLHATLPHHEPTAEQDATPQPEAAES